MIGRLIASQATRAVLALVALAVIFVGTLFAGFAIFLALVPYMNEAGAAAIVAALFLIPILVGALVVRASATPRRPVRMAAAAPPPPPPPPQDDPQAAAMAAIAGLARDKPLAAVGLAVVMGAVMAYLNRTR
jgi:hypothetical protein